MIYLASNSPRRRELLEQISVPYQVLLLRNRPGRDQDVDETPLDNEPASVYVQRIAQYKAQVGWKRVMQRALPLHPLLAADTTVSFQNQIFGKPQNLDDAARILKLLSGHTHQVLTSVAVIFQEHMECVLSVTDVTFHELSDEEIARYIRQESILDKAGAYGLQGRAATFIKRLAGSDSGVKGLPLFETTHLLKRFGIII